jgi:chromosomal replication initiator protein
VQQIWEAALGELQIQVNKPNYRTWLHNTVGVSYNGEELCVSVPNTFVAEYLEKNQRSLIEKVLTGLIHRDIQVQFRVENNPKESASSYSGAGSAAPVQQARLPLFNPRYTFGSFVVGGGNQLAYISQRDNSTVLCVRSMDTGQQREYTPSIGGYFDRPAWSARMYIR